MSKNHCIIFNKKMKQAKQFVGMNDKIHKVEYNNSLLYNVLMEEYDTIVVNNLVCETLHPKNGMAMLYKYLQKLNPEEQNIIINNYNDHVNKKHTLKKKLVNLLFVRNFQ
jgi:DNA-directed RNA polymerase sigma subunit (sigma70/sigma32)